MNTAICRLQVMFTKPKTGIIARPCALNSSIMNWEGLKVFKLISPGQLVQFLASTQPVSGKTSCNLNIERRHSELANNPPPCKGQTAKVIVGHKPTSLKKPVRRPSKESSDNSETATQCSKLQQPLKGGVIFGLTAKR